MRVKFGLAEARYDSLTVVIILRVASRTIGIVVDGVSDVMALAPNEVKPAPPLGAIVNHAFLAGLATREDRMVLLLDIEKFLSSGEMDLLERVADQGAPATP
jgi:purine-binding chemotaxis protein CheW